MLEFNRLLLKEVSAGTDAMTGRASASPIAVRAGISWYMQKVTTLTDAFLRSFPEAADLTLLPAAVRPSARLSCSHKLTPMLLLGTSLRAWEEKVEKPQASLQMLIQGCSGGSGTRSGAGTAPQRSGKLVLDLQLSMVTALRNTARHRSHARARSTQPRRSPGSYGPAGSSESCLPLYAVRRCGSRRNYACSSSCHGFARAVVRCRCSIFRQCCCFECSNITSCRDRHTL